MHLNEFFFTSEIRWFLMQWSFLFLFWNNVRRKGKPKPRYQLILQSHQKIYSLLSFLPACSLITIPTVRLHLILYMCVADIDISFYLGIWGPVPSNVDSRCRVCTTSSLWQSLADCLFVFNDCGFLWAKCCRFVYIWCNSFFLRELSSNR